MRKFLVQYLPLALMLLFCSCNPDFGTKNNAPDFDVELVTIRKGYVPDTMWTQAYVSGVPGNPPSLLVTLSQLLGAGIDNYGDLFYYEGDYSGSEWSGPLILMERTALNDSVEMVLSDLYPGLHEKSGKVLGTGKLFFYDPTNSDDPEIGRGIGYTVYDPKEGKWEPLKIFRLPEKDHSDSIIYNPSAGCTQRYDLPGGDILLPVYYLRQNIPEGNNISTVVRCRFDGKELSYIEHGSELTIYRDRGFVEPSIIGFGDQYYLTLRCDHSAFVSKSDDGLNFSKPIEWTFTDGQILGSYNTQAHWIKHQHTLLLVYTRRGLDNDHIFRHRAPLVMGKVEPDKLQVIRETESILIPQRGARLGNFGVARVDDGLTVVSTSERMTQDSESYGADNSVFVAMIHWKD